MMKIESLKKRADFLALRRAPAISKRGFKLVRGHANGNTPNGDTPNRNAPNFKAPNFKAQRDDVVRVGFTVTKKLGNAVRRNRIRRRLKSAIMSVLPLQDDANADYVVIAHRGAYDMSYPDLLKEMVQALTDIQLSPIKRSGVRVHKTPNDKILKNKN